MKKTAAFVLASVVILFFLVDPGFAALPRYEITDLGTLGSGAEYAMLKFQGTHTQPLRVPADYQTIQAAIDAAVDGDVVIVAPGLYSGDGNRDIDFNGKAITVRSIDPNDPNIVAATIIDCNGTETDMHRGFYFHNDEDANSLLDGFTITNGYMHGYPEPANGGGGICCEQSSPTILNCTITHNSAGRAGGGIFCNFSSNPRIANCNINENWVVSDGGGVFCYRSSPTIINCVIKSNIALFEGGGVYCHENSRAIINNCIIADNVASYYKGGGIMCRVISHRFPA